MTRAAAKPGSAEPKKGTAAAWVSKLLRVTEKEAQELAAEASRLRGRPVDIGPAGKRGRR